MSIELVDEGLCYERQKRISAYYKGRVLGEYQIDLLLLVFSDDPSAQRRPALPVGRATPADRDLGAPVSLWPF